MLKTKMLVFRKPRNMHVLPDSCSEPLFQIGLILLSLSMFGSLLFGLYHHFLAVSLDQIHSQPASAWGTTFVLTAYLLLITEAIGTYVGVHFLWTAKETSTKAVKT